MARKRDLLVSDVIRRAFTHSFRRLVAHEADLGRSDDPEAVHRARVATRRLRSDLHTFKPFLDACWADDLRAEVAWLGSELGAVRDVEVQRDRLRSHAGALPPAAADDARRVVRRLDADREAARVDLVAALAGPHYARVRAGVAAATHCPAFSDAAREPAAEALRAVLRRRWKKLDRMVRDLGSEPPDDALHAVRKQAKRCRYAAEACEPVLGRRARRFAKAMARVQRVLGEHHDAVVATAWLEETARECTPAEAYAVGMLAQVERDSAQEARRQFARVWSRADTDRVRGWL
jgi:CHAD domain-containing protein